MKLEAGKQPASLSVDETIKQRDSVHGDYQSSAKLLMDIVTKLQEAADECDTKLSPDQRLSLTMILLKVARIVSGDPNFADHWHDIAGYARLVEQRLTATKT